MNAKTERATVQTTQTARTAPTSPTAQVVGQIGDAIVRSGKTPKTSDRCGSPRALAELAELAELARWLKLLSEPNRLKILDLLMQGEQCNCEMGGTLGMAPNLISHHLSVLQKAGLVNARRDEMDARWIHFSIDPEALTDLNRTFRGFSSMFHPDRLRSNHNFTARCAPRNITMNPEALTK